MTDSVGFFVLASIGVDCFHLRVTTTCCLRLFAAVSLGALTLAVGAASTNTAKPDLTVPKMEALKAMLPVTRQSTRPDYVVFTPTLGADGAMDSGNEHFLVFDGPDGALMAVWTQSTREGEPDQHIVFTSSSDEGRTWARPRLIAGPAKSGDGFMASWAFPLVSKQGRIYVLYSQHVGKFDTFPHHTGLLTGIYSDDLGLTWSRPQTIPMPRTSRDNPDQTYPPNCIIWQKPQRLASSGRYIVGLSRWTSFAVRKNPTKYWISADSAVEFMRFENLDTNPTIENLKISWLSWDKDALTVPFPGHPEVSACQEPSIVKLPDNRLFCVMRTSAGSPYWALSADDGTTWTRPKPLLNRDGGPALKHPLSPCPIFDIGSKTGGSGRYALFIHNHDGNVNQFTAADTLWHRRPIYLLHGRFDPKAAQPITFDEPKLFMDHDGVPLGAPGGKGRWDLALYSSMTIRDGKAVLWYPDRKFFLLGKRVQ